MCERERENGEDEKEKREGFWVDGGGDGEWFILILML